MAALTDTYPAQPSRSTWRKPWRAASSATDASAKSNGKSWKRPLINSTCAKASGKASAPGASSVKPPLCPQRKKSSAAALLTRRASSGPLSATTVRAAVPVLAAARRTGAFTSGFAMAGRGNRCRACGMFLIPNLLQRSPALAGQICRPSMLAKQILPQCEGRKGGRCRLRQIRLQSLAHQCAGRAPQGRAALTQSALQWFIKLDGHGHGAGPSKSNTTNITPPAVAAERSTTPNLPARYTFN